DEVYARSMASHDIKLMLEDKIGGFPYIEAVMLIGSDGTVINSSVAWPTPRLNVADQDYFQALKATPALSSKLGRPVKDPRTGTWTVPLARKFMGADGEFLGLVVGMIKSRHFEELYGTLVHSADESIALVGRDGVTLARYPHVDPMVDKSVSSGRLAEMTRPGAGVVRERDARDGVDRLIAATSLVKVPIFLTTSTRVSPTRNHASVRQPASAAWFLVGLTL